MRIEAPPDPPHTFSPAALRRACQPVACVSSSVESTTGTPSASALRTTKRSCRWAKPCTARCTGALGSGADAEGPAAIGRV